MNEPQPTTRAAPAPTLRTHYLALLTPLILTHALQSAGGLLDGFWLGRMLGVRGIATAASFFPVFFLLLSLIIGLGAGVKVLAGQSWGARDAARVRRVGAAAFGASLGVGRAVAAARASSPPCAVKASGGPPDVLPVPASVMRLADERLQALPEATRRSITRTSSTGIGPCSMRSDIEVPDTNSITMQGRPMVGSTVNT